MPTILHSPWYYHAQSRNERAKSRQPPIQGNTSVISTDGMRYTSHTRATREQLTTHIWAHQKQNLDKRHADSFVYRHRFRNRSSIPIAPIIPIAIVRRRKRRAPFAAVLCQVFERIEEFLAAEPADGKQSVLSDGDADVRPSDAHARTETPRLRARVEDVDAVERHVTVTSTNHIQLTCGVNERCEWKFPNTYKGY